ncbi:hypothetical protein APTSU1_000823800 [Apodemus speciosus]|uniref:Uncharacterized protein n=1 Tax=Apodemus speciosus TaxID=105296 RepID=A0ABQ0F139_APOSI
MTRMMAPGQVNLEDDRKKRSQDEAEKMDLKCAKMDPEKSDSEASATGEQDNASKGRCSSVDEEQHAESMKLDHLEKQVIACAIKEEKRLPNDTGDLSEDE